jgi:hypothetical protein
MTHTQESPRGERLDTRIAEEHISPVRGANTAPKPPTRADDAGITSGRNPAAATTSWDSTPHGGWRWGGRRDPRGRLPLPVVVVR